MLEFNTLESTSFKMVTKRVILSSVEQIFYPVSLLSPNTITGKIIMQQLWRLKIDWDESIHLFTTWTTYSTQLKYIQELRIPRLIHRGNVVKIELHGFSDAAEAAYGACIYVRSIDNLGNITSRLLCSKSRVK